MLTHPLTVLLFVLPHLLKAQQPRGILDNYRLKSATFFTEKLVRQPLFILLLQASAILGKTLTEVIRLDGSTLNQWNYRRSKRHEQLRLGVAVSL